MKESLCDDFLNSRKIMYPMAQCLGPYIRGKSDFMPWSVEIHPTARCNHACIHCSYKERNESRAEMPKDMFFSLLDSLIKMGVHGVYFSGGGEPCIYPWLKEGIRKLNDNGVEVAIVSNGSLFEKYQISEIADRFNYIALSVPSCIPEMFKRITGTENLDKVLNLPDAIKDRFGNKSPVVGARVVVTNLIADEVPHILATLQERSFDYAIFKAVRDYEDRGLGISDDMAKQLQAEIESLSAQGKLDRSFTNLDSIFSYRKPYETDGICHINRMGLLAAVTPEGDVYPNICEIGRKEFLVGNISDKPFEKLWNSDSHCRVKDCSDAQWKTGRCRDCRAISYNVRINGMVKDLPCKEDPFI